MSDSILVLQPGGSTLAETMEQRYGSTYRVEVLPAGQVLLETCRELVEADTPPILVVIGTDNTKASEAFTLMREVRGICPAAKRMVVISWGSVDRPQMLRQSVEDGTVDSLATFPLNASDEHFHLAVTTLLVEGRGQAPGGEVVRVVGDPWAARSYELRDLLTRNAVPFGFYDAGSNEGRQMLESVQLDGSRLPVLLLQNGQVLIDPSNLEGARALGTPEEVGDEPFDVTVVGAGPAGLAAAVYASSEGLRTLVVEREAVGGQAGSSSMIRNYLGFPRGISGVELATRANEQAFRFGTFVRLMVEVLALEPGDYLHRLHLNDGSDVESRTVIIATGVAYRRLDVEGIERLAGSGIYYGAALSEAPSLTGAPTFVVGGGNSAGQAALHLARTAGSVTVLVRGDSLADSMSDYLIRELREMDNIDIRYRTEVTGAGGESRLERLRLHDGRSGETYEVEAAALFILIGGLPRTEWVAPLLETDPNGYVLTGADLDRGGVGQFETSIPGVFAVGDVRFGSVKRVASAAGEGAVAITSVHRYLDSRLARG